MNHQCLALLRLYLIPPNQFIAFGLCKHCLLCHGNGDCFGRFFVRITGDSYRPCGPLWGVLLVSLGALLNVLLTCLLLVFSLRIVGYNMYLGLFMAHSIFLLWRIG